eukprot:18812-Heterococcus_DN1.PRE.1
MYQSYQNIEDGKGSGSSIAPFAPVQYGDFSVPTSTAFPPTVQVNATGGFGSSSFAGAGEGQRLADTYSLGRGVKILSMIDAGILLLNAVLYGPIFLIVLLLGCWGPIAGFVAGKHYNVLWGRVYLAFYCLKVLSDTFHLFTSGLWFILPLALDCYIGRFVYLYCILLSEASDAEISSLKDAPNAAMQQARPYFVLF